MITAATADQIEALGLTIFDPHSDPAVSSVEGPATGLQAPDASVDAQLAALLTEPMLTIDGRTLAVGFRYTLNITNALQLRPKHWYMELEEYNVANPGVSSQWPCFCGLQLVPDAPTGFSYSVQSSGFTIGLVTCAAICHAWAAIIRMWLAGNYPLAVNPAP